MNEKFSPPEPIKSIFGWVSSIVALISSITGLILLWQGNKEIVTIIVVLTGILFLWLSLVYFRVAQKKPNKKHKYQKTKSYLYSAKVRKVALLGIYIIPIAALGGIGGGFWVDQQPSDKIMILVANFDGPEPNTYRVTDFILESLRDAIRDQSEIKILPLNQTITIQQGSEYAQALGQKHKAYLVVWGWYSVTDSSVYVSTHMEQLNVKSGFNGSSQNFSAFEGVTQSAIEANSFVFQSGLSDSIAATSMFSIAQILDLEKKYTKAIELYTKAIAILPENEEQYLLNKSQILSERAIAFAHASNFEEALKDVNEAIEIRPSDNYATYEARGLIYFYQQNYLLALNDYETAFNGSKAVIALYMMGMSNLMLGNQQTAIDIFGEVIKLEPNNYLPYFQRGVIYRDLGLNDKARLDFQEVLELSEDENLINFTKVLIKNTP